MVASILHQVLNLHEDPLGKIVTEHVQLDVGLDVRKVWIKDIQVELGYLPPELGCIWAALHLVVSFAKKQPRSNCRQNQVRAQRVQRYLLSEQSTRCLGQQSTPHFGPAHLLAFSRHMSPALGRSRRGNLYGGLQHSGQTASAAAF
ncbi:MAG: hypothetical protein JXQ75_04595 [Phycisphaerae bacterium]|nr:hypothetical protein [Phycisphaerae bacterium]